MKEEIKVLHGTALQTNNYVVTCGESAFLVDASANPEKALAIINNKTVTGIFLTHIHWDHVERLDELEKHLKTKIYLSKEDFEKIQNPKLCPELVDVRIKTKKSNFKIVKDGDVVNFSNDEIKIISTPGHENGCLSFLYRKNLFSGDTLFRGTCGRCDLTTGSEKDMTKSLEKLLTLDEDIKVYPGHGFSTTIKAEKKTFGGGIRE